MRTRNIYILSACLAAAFSCTQFEEENIVANESEKVQMSFTATICDESDTGTKTVLDGQLGDNLRKVLWTPEDEIGIYANDGTQSYSLNKFTNTAEENSETAVFEGGATIAEEYYAIYPYDQSAISWSYSDTQGNNQVSILFEIPEVQKYVKGTFAENTAPMIAKAGYGETFQFKNLCGILALNLTGEEKVKSLTFSGKNAEGNFLYVSGDFQILMDYTDDPVIVAGPEGPTGQALLETTSKSVTLECEEAVQLSTSEATPFYFVLPPTTYETFIITITTEDGKVMMKEGTKPLTIKRSDVQPTSDLAYVETVDINLSENGIANCYIVPESGVYSFKADVIGNGDYGLIEGAGFHTDNTSITPYSAELLWCDNEGAITGVSYDENNKCITFIATGPKGNAVIAAKDENGTILWSWHIWMTDQPDEHLYKNNTGEYTVLDRNLGATRAVMSDVDSEWQATKGLAYQWGRKDPFTKNRFYQGMMNPSGSYTTSTEQVPIETTIQNPNTFYGVDHSFWIDESNSSLWTVSKKTIYDPCPAGYKVGYSDIWKSFTTDGYNVHGEYDRYNIESADRNGWNFLYDGSNATYYPANWEINIEGNASEYYYVTLWSSQNYNSTSSYAFRSYYYNESDSHVMPSDHREDLTKGHMVRCMKDDSRSDLLIEVESVTNTTTSTAQLNGRISVYSGKEVSETGFVIGTTSDVHIATGTVIQTGKRTGSISAQVSGLTGLTKYYVKAYVAFTDGDTEYSEVVSFITPNEDGIIDISVNGKANCYIVHPTAGTYGFSLVKGNSSESVGEAVSAKIIWETQNINNAEMTVNSVIESAEIAGDMMKFKIPATPKTGNALIAALDAYGTVLWSWHIWVVDFVPEVTEQTYMSGKIMMDRNLGATSVIPVSDPTSTGDYSAFGLYYQWGRKDPFPYLGTVVPENAIMIYDYADEYNSIDYTIKHPNEVYNGVNWNDCTTLWGETKTIYDPCPYGWRVADSDAWEGWDTGCATNIDRYKKIDEPYSTPAAYYPHADRIEGYSTYSGFDNGLWWTNTYHKNLYTHSSYSQFTLEEWSIDIRMSVRCQRDYQDVVIGGGVDIGPY